MNPLNQISHSDVKMRGLPERTEGRTLSTILSRIVPFPSSALFVGLAEDGLPVHINLRDPAPSPVLIAADAGAGKTRLLQTVARAIEITHDPERVRYAVISAHPEEWAAFEHASHCDALLGFHHALTTGYLRSLALRPPSIDSYLSLVLMLDGFETLASDADLRDTAASLLRRPHTSRLLPMVTLNTSGVAVPGSWLDAFRVRLFGYIRDRNIGSGLTQAPGSLTSELQPPCQFLALEEVAWLRFWLPDLD